MGLGAISYPSILWACKINFLISVLVDTSGTLLTFLELLTSQVFLASPIVWCQLPSFEMSSTRYPIRSSVPLSSIIRRFAGDPGGTPNAVVPGGTMTTTNQLRSSVCSRSPIRIRNPLKGFPLGSQSRTPGIQPVADRRGQLNGIQSRKNRLASVELLR